MALFSRKPKPPAKTAEPDEDDEAENLAPGEVGEEAAVELKAEALAPKKARGGIIKGAVTMLVVTLIAAGGGIGLGMQNAANMQAAIRAAAAPSDQPVTPPKIPPDTLVKVLDPVITNLASPLDTWIRLETAMVFKNGSLANPDVTAAELRQDEVAYLRTIDISQLEGPSALQHLREDLNERASLRTGGKVSELIIETLIVQ